MNKIKDNCFNDFDSNAISVEIAVQKILRSIKTKASSERVKIKQALGRVLAEDIKSTINVPNYKNSAMDGYAINVEDFSQENNIFCKKIIF